MSVNIGEHNLCLGEFLDNVEPLLQEAAYRLLRAAFDAYEREFSWGFNLYGDGSDDFDPSVKAELCRTSGYGCIEEGNVWEGEAPIALTLSPDVFQEAIDDYVDAHRRYENFERIVTHGEKAVLVAALRRWRDGVDAAIVRAEALPSVDLGDGA